MNFCERELKLLPKKNVNTKNNEKKRYIVLLKRKRIENRMTLEKLADGICTASYLSRIENLLVDVDDSYYYRLFKKLNIDFDQLREEMHNEIFTEILKNHMKNDDEKVVDLISKALKTNFYVDVEYDLMLLYDNIIKKMYTDARKLILDLNEKVEVLCENELTFFLFLSTLYAYKTYQGRFAYKQIMILCEMDMVEPLFKYAVYDLALDIFEYVGNTEMFFKYYQLLNDESYLTSFSFNALKHKAQYTYLAYQLSSMEVNSALESIKSCLPKYYYDDVNLLILKNYYRFENYDEILNMLKCLPSTPFYLSFEAILNLIIDDKDMYSDFMERLKFCKFNQWEKHYEMLVNVCCILKRDGNATFAFDELKKLLELQFSTVNNDFFINVELVILTNVASRIRKFKEALALISLYLDKKMKILHF